MTTVADRPRTRGGYASSARPVGQLPPPTTGAVIPPGRVPLRAIRWRRLAAVLLPLLLAAVALAALARAATVSTVAYGADPGQVMDVYRDPDAGARPTLLLIHGGSWRTGSRTDVAGQAVWWQAQGYTVASIDYRLSGDAIWPAQRADVYAAVAWLKAHAALYRVDPDRVGLVGYSAGGHIATAAGTYGAGASKVKAVVAASPITSPMQAWTDGGATGASAAQRGLREDVERLMGCTPAQRAADAGCRSRWAGSDARLAAGPGDAPVYAVASEGDFVPPSHGLSLCTELSADVPCVAQVIAGSGHGNAVATQVSGQIAKWLEANL